MTMTREVVRGTKTNAYLDCGRRVAGCLVVRCFRVAPCFWCQLCRTPAGNVCEVVTLANLTARDCRPLSMRKTIVVSARVHPGESSSSWTALGLLQHLAGTSDDVSWLLKNYVVKVVPMLNPDGVINGNYRTGIRGGDLNRVWDVADADQHPTVHYLKALLAELQAGNGVALYCDMHGHVRAVAGFTRVTVASPQVAIRG